MAELADAPALGAGTFGCVGSTPTDRTIFKHHWRFLYLTLPLNRGMLASTPLKGGSMQRLARAVNNDRKILEELESAGIPAIEIERRGQDDIPAAVAGRLGVFDFRRYLDEWRVEGDMPLALALVLHSHPDNRPPSGVARTDRVYCRPSNRQIIMPRGLKAGDDFGKVVVYKDSDGIILEPMTRRIESARVRAHVYGEEVGGKPKVRFVDSPSSLGKPYITSYSVLYLEGLKLFAHFLRVQHLSGA